MLLKDQYPISQNKEVEVELLESSNAGNYMVNEEIRCAHMEIFISAGSSGK